MAKGERKNMLHRLTRASHETDFSMTVASSQSVLDHLATYCRGVECNTMRRLNNGIFSVCFLQPSRPPAEELRWLYFQFVVSALYKYTKLCSTEWHHWSLWPSFVSSGLELLSRILGQVLSLSLNSWMQEPQGLNVGHSACETSISSHSP